MFDSRKRKTNKHQAQQLLLRRSGGLNSDKVTLSMGCGAGCGALHALPVSVATFSLTMRKRKKKEKKHVLRESSKNVHEDENQLRSQFADILVDAFQISGRNWSLLEEKDRTPDLIS